MIYQHQTRCRMLAEQNDCFYPLQSVRKSNFFYLDQSCRLRAGSTHKAVQKITTNTVLLTE